MEKLKDQKAQSRQIADAEQLPDDALEQAAGGNPPLDNPSAGFSSPIKQQPVV